MNFNVLRQFYLKITDFLKINILHQNLISNANNYISSSPKNNLNVQKVGMMIKMWEKVNEKFKKYPARIRVAEKMIELGLSLSDDGKIYCGNLKISDKALATAADVDRRAIKSTIDIIREDEELYNLFSNIIPAGTLLKNIAKNLELGVIEIEVGSESEGILAKTTSLISEKGISIRQAYAEDTELQQSPILTIITEEPVKGDLINEFLKIKGVTRVSIY